MAKKKYYDSGYMVKNDNSEVANMPSDVMLKQYPENPSYFPETYIDDSINGVDKMANKMAKSSSLVKGMVE